MKYRHCVSIYEHKWTCPLKNMIYLDGLNTWSVEIQLNVRREPHPTVFHTVQSGRNGHLPSIQICACQLTDLRFVNMSFRKHDLKNKTRCIWMV